MFLAYGLFLFCYSFLESEITATRIGYFTGSLISMLVLASLLAWLGWRLSGYRRWLGSFAFTITLTLVLLAQIGQLLDDKSKERQKLVELKSIQQDFKTALSNTDDPAEAELAYNEFADSVKDKLSNLSKESDGSNSEFYQIMSDFVTDWQVIVQNWRAAFNYVQSSRILDFSRLVSEEEFAHQESALIEYIEQSKLYQESFEAMVPDLKERLRVLGENSSIVTGAIQGASQKYYLQRPVFIPLIRAHITYGTNMLDILKLLKLNKQDWTFENGEMLISSDSVLIRFNELVDSLTTQEATISELSDKLIELM